MTWARARHVVALGDLRRESGLWRDRVETLGAERSRLAWRGERTALADVLVAQLREGDVLITMGAGDITKTGRDLLARLRKVA